jgi:hypothetical protein
MNEVMITTAAQANDAHRRIEKLGNALKEEALGLGKFLSEQKVKAGHGNWQAWMKANLQFSERTAQRYILLYEKRNELGWGEILTLADSENENRQGMSDLQEDPSHTAVPANPTPPAAIPSSSTQALKKLTKPKQKPAPAKKVTAAEHTWTAWALESQESLDSREAEGRIEKTGAMRDGKPVYRLTEKGRIWRDEADERDRLKEEQEDEEGDSVDCFVINELLAKEEGTEYYYVRPTKDGFRLAFRYGDNSGDTFGKPFPTEQEAQKLADELNSYVRDILEDFCNRARLTSDELRETNEI